MKNLSLITHSFSVGLFLLFNLLTVVAQSSASCDQVHRRDASESKIKLSQQSSVELEIGATPKVMELVDTLDGTIRPVMGEAPMEAIPEGLQKSIRDFVGPEGDPYSLPWDVLSSHEKSELIMASAKARGQSFHLDRKIPGLKHRESFEVVFTEPTAFLGKTYPKGKHLITASEVFNGTAIEFMAPTRMTEDLGFELHIRSHNSAGDNFQTARTLQKILIGQYQNVHLHMVAPYPGRNLIDKAPNRLHRFLAFIKSRIFRIQAEIKPSEVKAAQVFRAAEFSRRMMLHFEFKMIERGFPMTTIKDSDGSLSFFPFESRPFLNFVNSLFVHSKETQGSSQNSKAGTVGLRTSHFYDQDVWGLEIRYLAQRFDVVTTARDLDLFQQRMLGEKYFVTEEQAMVQVQGKKLNGVSSSIHSRLQLATEKLLYSANTQKKMEDAHFSDAKIKILNEAIAANDLVRMLVHDWSQDPIFNANPDRIRQVKETQAIALNYIFSGRPSVEVMQYFIKRSGMAYDLAKSLK